MNRRNWRRHVSGASFSCLVCTTWTQVSGDQFLVPETWAENLGRVPSTLGRLHKKPLIDWLVDVCFVLLGNGALGESRYHSPRSSCKKRTGWVRTFCHADKLHCYTNCPGVGVEPSLAHWSDPLAVVNFNPSPPPSWGRFDPHIESSLVKRCLKCSALVSCRPSHGPYYGTHRFVAALSPACHDSQSQRHIAVAVELALFGDDETVHQLCKKVTFSSALHYS